MAVSEVPLVVSNPTTIVEPTFAELIALGLEHTGWDPSKFVSFDLETFAIEETVLTPKLVCGSMAVLDPDAPIRPDGSGWSTAGCLLSRDEAIAAFERILLDPEVVVVGANIAFDLGVMANERPEWLVPILDALDQNRVFDVLLARGLEAIAGGFLGRSPTGGVMRKPSTGKVVKRYSLEVCVHQVLGRVDAKEHDEWRLRYGELASVPMDEWPWEARQYPVDDAVNALECALAEVTGRGKWDRAGGEPGRPSRNLQDLSEQCRAAFAEHLACIRGLPVDQEAVSAYEAIVMAGRRTGLKATYADGLYRLKGSKKATREIAGEEFAARWFEEEKKAAEEKRPPSHELDDATLAKIEEEVRRAKGVDKDPRLRLSKNTVQIKRRVLAAYGGGLCTCSMEADDFVGCEECDKTGIKIVDGVKRTDTGEVSTGREVLEELTEDAGLVLLAEVGKSDKAATTYIPYLRKGVPTIHPRPNVLLETGRSSYDGPMQQMPRKGGERACIVPEHDHRIVSADWCFVAGTEIDTPHGNIPIEKLKLGQPVYSYRFERRRPVVGHVTQKVLVGMAPIVRVTLDNGRVVRCTPEHKWLKCPRVQNDDPEYVQAKDLKSGDRLLPLRRVYAHGYSHLYAHKAIEYVKEHIAVAEATFGARPNGAHVHHKNEDRRDNRPENLEYVVASEHLSGHYTLDEAMKDPAIREKHSKNVKAALVARGGHHGENNPRWGDKRKQKETVCERCGKKFWHTGERSFCSRKCYAGEGVFTKPCAQCGTPFSDYSCHAWRKFCSRACSDAGRERKPAVVAKRRCALCNAEFERTGSRIGKYCSQTCANRNHYAESRLLTKVCLKCGKPFQYYASNAKRKFCSSSCVIQSGGRKLGPSIEQTCLYCEKKFEHRAKTGRRFCSHACANRGRAHGLNHKVVSVEFDGFADVWSIEVSPDHNYALAAGVFVGNSGIECVTWSQACIWLLGYSTMGESILAGKDIHSDLAAEFMSGFTWEEIKKLAKADPQSEAGLMRQAAKPCNFGLPGGMGVLTFVLTQRKQGVIICRYFGNAECRFVLMRRRPRFRYDDDEEETERPELVRVCEVCFFHASNLRQKWMDKWREAKPYFDRVTEIVETAGEVPTLVPDSIDPRGYVRMRGGVHRGAALNNFFQSLAAAGAKRALWRLTRECYDGKNPILRGCTPRFFMHDEFLLMSPEVKAKEAAKEMERIMIEEMQLFVPDVAAGVKVESKIMARWAK